MKKGEIANLEEFTSPALRELVALVSETHRNQLNLSQESQKKSYLTQRKKSRRDENKDPSARSRSNKAGNDVIEIVKKFMIENQILQDQVKTLEKEKKELNQDKETLQGLLEKSEIEIQSLKAVNSEFQHTINSQSEKISKLQTLLNTKCYKYLLNNQPLEEESLGRQVHILTQKLQKAEEDMQVLLKKEALYDKANQNLRRRLRKSQSSMEIFDRKTSQKHKENNRNSELKSVKDKLEKVYKLMLLELHRINEKEYSMSLESFCKVEREINLILMDMHENIEIEKECYPRTKHQRRKTTLDLSSILVSMSQKQLNRRNNKIQPM